MWVFDLMLLDELSKAFALLGFVEVHELLRTAAVFCLVFRTP